MTAARKIRATETTEWTGLGAGHVITLGDRIGVELSTGETVDARRAKSCLTMPEVGDRVLCAIGVEETFIIAVLEGQADAPNRLVSDAAVELSSRQGDVSVVAAGAVSVTGMDGVRLTGKELHVRAGLGTVAIDRLGFVGRELDAKLGRLALVAEQADQLVDRLVQKAKRVYRFVEEMDQTRAGTIDLRAEKLLGLRAENAIISARVVAKIDGEQIHIG